MEAPNFIKITITSAAFDIRAEKGFDVDQTLAQFKDRLALVVGCEPANQQLQLFAQDGDAEPTCTALEPDTATLSDVGIVAGCRVHVVDTSADAGQLFVNDGQVSKVELSDQQYEDRIRKRIPLGSTVKVIDRGVTGVVKYVGPVHVAPGVWVGVELEDATGKHDGMVRGTRYFQTKENHGVFSKHQKVQVLSTPDDAGDA